MDVIYRVTHTFYDSTPSLRASAKNSTVRPSSSSNQPQHPTPGTSAVTVTQPLAEVSVAEANAPEMFEKSEESVCLATRLVYVLLLVDEVVNIWAHVRTVRLALGLM